MPDWYSHSEESNIQSTVYQAGWSGEKDRFLKLKKSLLYWDHVTTLCWRDICLELFPSLQLLPSRYCDLCIGPLLDTASLCCHRGARGQLQHLSRFLEHDPVMQNCSWLWHKVSKSWIMHEGEKCQASLNSICAAVFTLKVWTIFSKFKSLIE